MTISILAYEKHHFQKLQQGILLTRNIKISYYTMEVEVAPKQIAVKPIELKSEAFENNGTIPEKYTCDGDNINPPLSIGDFPKETQSLVIIVDDPDAPIRTWTHWVAWNINPTHSIKEGATPGKVGINDFWLNKYSGPCPPSGTHHYHFKVYALDRKLEIPMKISGKCEIEKAMKPHIIGKGEIVGCYKKRA